MKTSIKYLNHVDTASLSDVKRGYVETQYGFSCVFCGFQTESGVIYDHDGIFYDARRTMSEHVSSSHGGAASAILALPASETGISEHQSNIIRLFMQGKNDAEIQGILGIGSISTVRNHRAILKAKERQAKLTLAVLELLRERQSAVRSDENAGEPAIARYFQDGPEGRLSNKKIKQTDLPAVLRHIANRFNPGREYSEKEVNRTLAAVHEDYALFRRYLVDFGILERDAAGRRYRLKVSPMAGGRKMDRKKELIMEYKQQKVESGVYRILNKANGKMLVVAVPNLRRMNGKQFQLQMNSHSNRELQEDWNKYGETSFVFEILETVKEKDEPGFDKAKELEKLEAKWLEKLNPYSPHGYNERKRQIKSV